MAISAWIFVAIIILVIFLVSTLIKKKQSAATFFAITLTVFLVISIAYVFIENNIPFTIGGILDGIKIYLYWLLTTMKNFVDITSYAIKKDWSAKNETIKVLLGIVL
ncbi:MAG: hypothetical protein KatS3mg001_129 [Candidatus Pacearchaeota archaeon]|nr:MAG: hypothetical protein KatS3mg001_129 [Candidatus Pacearchaeota archaeon]